MAENLSVLVICFKNIRSNKYLGLLIHMFLIKHSFINVHYFASMLGLLLVQFEMSILDP